MPVPFYSDTSRPVRNGTTGVGGVVQVVDRQDKFIIAAAELCVATSRSDAVSVAGRVAGAEVLVIVKSDMHSATMIIRIENDVLTGIGLEIGLELCFDREAPDRLRNTGSRPGFFVRKLNDEFPTAAA
ncbi:hypothetical protein BRC87_10620 [Halobacteriales archaeon QS_4_66_20]|nr:MAG: hypothetical protein BRC87_10620 [Halobacteriales archaeon QS_4_66_20]